MESFPIVGIGSSAGGVEALQTMFRSMPPATGVAFVVAAHLDPDRESHLSELLGRCTTMPVVQIAEEVKVEPDSVYVIAPNQYLTIRAGVLRPEQPSEPRGHRHPVDAFFRSLAEDHDGHAPFRLDEAEPERAVGAGAGAGEDDPDRPLTLL